MPLWVPVSGFAKAHRYTVKAIYHKRDRGRWPAYLFQKAPDGSILIDEEGWQSWVTDGQASPGAVLPASGSSPPPLTDPIDPRPWITQNKSFRDWFRAHYDQYLVEPQHLIATAHPRGTPPDKPGVYFLILDARIVYVGRSTSMKNRFTSHADKEFNRMNWLVIHVPKMAEKIESYYIHTMRPALNLEYPKLDNLVKGMVGFGR